MPAQQKDIHMIGSVVNLWRYPIKSMMGEELNAVELVEGSLLGDRRYALRDTETGKIASAKNPRKWPGLFDFRATFLEPPHINGDLPAIRVTLPNGQSITTEQAQFNDVVSQTLGRRIELASTGIQAPALEEYWPTVDGLTYNDTVTDEAMPEQTFFDLAPIYLLTTATLDRFHEFYPQGRFEARRFRPNIVIQPTSDTSDFVENAWVGQTLAIGPEVRLRITDPCPRCVMTTLPQGDLPQDLGILRTIVKHNNAHVGVYATLIQPGTVHRGDSISILP
ncbi:MOSC domain-containing protein [Dictyobacter kobayashii]|uniref:Molybdenum cofactor biosysynthesis protein n=1 Tax=Dictyobacter kobayashii TaxID=2014872 RepID=A0A402AJ73_9CHLR|nr:MOSC domain-containing protein [Dictyobacter kobayashii]GCE19105.1 molybdenum cofactor biosysynthesis protein [Dictyobacter kobayashii]